MGPGDRSRWHDLEAHTAHVADRGHRSIQLGRRRPEPHWEPRRAAATAARSNRQNPDWALDSALRAEIRKSPLLERCDAELWFLRVPNRCLQDGELLRPSRSVRDRLRLRLLEKTSSFDRRLLVMKARIPLLDLTNCRVDLGSGGFEGTLCFCTTKSVAVRGCGVLGSWWAPTNA